MIRHTCHAKTYTSAQVFKLVTTPQRIPSCAPSGPHGSSGGNTPRSREDLSSPCGLFKVEDFLHRVNLTNVMLLWLCEIVSFLLSCIICKVIFGTISSSQFFKWEYCEPCKPVDATGLKKECLLHARRERRVLAAVLGGFVLGLIKGHRPLALGDTRQMA